MIDYKRQSCAKALHQHFNAIRKNKKTMEELIQLNQDSFMLTKPQTEFKKAADTETEKS